MRAGLRSRLLFDIPRSLFDTRFSISNTSHICNRISKIAYHMILPQTPRSGFSYFLNSRLGDCFKEAFYPSAKADGNCIVFSMPLLDISIPPHPASMLTGLRCSHNSSTVPQFNIPTVPYFGAVFSISRCRDNHPDNPGCSDLKMHSI